MDERVMPVLMADTSWAARGPRSGNRDFGLSGRSMRQTVPAVGIGIEIEARPRTVQLTKRVQLTGIKA